MTEAPKELRDPDAPAGMKIFTEARVPEFDPTAGQLLGKRKKPQPEAAAKPKHRLVTLGDSLTHGFQSGAIYNTEISYPRIIAWEMGWSRQFRYPRYGGPGGLPLNIEYVVRRLEREFGDRLDWWELGSAGFSVRACMDEIEDYWERGPGSQPNELSGINHNLAIYGWDVRDALSRTAGVCARSIMKPKDDWIDQIVGNANDRAALRVLPPLKDKTGETDEGTSSVDAAKALGDDGGIETLIVFLGANNALPSVLDLKVAWSDVGYDDLEKKKAFTVWNPEHFAVEFDELAKRVSDINARHVIFATVPHVTIAPVARGVSRKVRPQSRYFPYYTRPWISDVDFDAKDDPHLTENQARAIDAAIDHYNNHIVEAVRTARKGGLDWFVLDVGGVLDRLASRRYIEDITAQPDWWRPYELPQVIGQLDPRPDSRFFASGPTGRQQGGLFSLDGVHPTTIAYGILAQEFINVMEAAGVPFYYDDGVTQRRGHVLVDFARLVALDTLISDPPRSLANDLKLVGWLDQKLDLFQRLF